MRGTDVIPVWEDVRPLICIMDSRHRDMSLRRVPHEVRDGIIEDFRKMKLEFRLSFYEEAEPDDEGTFESHLCLNCDTLLKTSESKWCSEHCKKEHTDKLKSWAIGYYQDLPTCVVCTKKIPRELGHIHHISYFPEVTIPLHIRCHVQIHKNKSHPELLPPEGDSAKFYGRKIQ